nr:hypothetical protein Iba_chr01bCG0130 [Ipomoea batatas]
MLILPTQAKFSRHKRSANGINNEQNSATLATSKKFKSQTNKLKKPNLKQNKEGDRHYEIRGLGFHSPMWPTDLHQFWSDLLRPRDVALPLWSRRHAAPQASRLRFRLHRPQAGEGPEEARRHLVLVVEDGNVDDDRKSGGHHWG